MKIFSKCYMGIIYFILYVPIAVLMLFSFNSGESTSTFVPDKRLQVPS